MHASSTSQSTRSNLRPVSSNDNAGPHHKLTPQEAALRGASLAFSKQQQQQQAQNARRQSLTPSFNNPAAQDGGALVAATSASRARSPTGSVSSRQGNRLSRQGTGTGNGRISRQTTGNSSIAPEGDVGGQPTSTTTEQERERLALFLGSPGPEQSRSTYLLPPGGRAAGGAGTDPKSTSFIAATLAASRSVSPGSGPAVQGGGGDERAGAAGRTTRLGEPAPIRRKANPRTDSPAVSTSTNSSDGLPDTAHLPPANSLISMFEHKGDQDVDPAKNSPSRPLVNRSKGWPLPDVQLDRDDEEEKNLGIENIKPRRKPVPKTKPKPSPKPKPKLKTTAGDETPSPPVIRRANTEIVSPKPRRPDTKPKLKTTAGDETPSPPVIRRANTEIVSPKPRRPDTKPKLNFEPPASPGEVTEKSNVTSVEGRKSKPEPPKPRRAEKSEATDQRTAARLESTDTAIPEPRPPTLPARASLPPMPTKPPAPKKRQTLQRLALAPSADGQDLSTPISPQDRSDGRPLTGDSMSSNDTFVSASSTPTRAESPPVFDPASRTLTPRALPPRAASARPVTPALPIRKNITGSSQLPIDSLSDAMMAGSLASARHTPVPGVGAHTPPPLPPSRRTGAGGRKAASRAASPHHMKKTLRDQRPKSDDEDARRPHHKKKGLINSKKHTHHEGSRRRWREEITERERKRYEAVWASNRGLFLVPPPGSAAQAQTQTQASSSDPTLGLRDRSYEELSEHVASVVVRDIWSRSRLPEPELAEVWDLVYGLGVSGNSSLEGRPRVAGALSKSEFVVGTWLIDQRLRGRKIPPRVSDSVWSSAKGLWSAAGRNPNHHRKKGKGK